MATQVRHESLDPESFVSPEMAALQGELDHCRQVGLTLFGFMGDDESEL